MRIFGFDVEISRQIQTDLGINESFHRPPPASWEPTHRHKKGGLYRYLYKGILESDHSAIVVYDDREGQVWVRAAKEFHDGRFLSVKTS